MSQGLHRSAIVELICAMRCDPTAPFRSAVAARRLDTSASNLIHAFTQVAGISPLRFRAALRIELAKRLLLESDAPVTHVCFDVGYGSVGTFTRTFTAAVGLSPTRFRELAEARPDGDLSGLPETARYPGPEAGPATRVEIEVTADALAARSVIVAGLFREGVPAGWPIDGCSSRGGSSLQLSWPHRLRSVSLLVAGVSASPRGDVWRPMPGDVSVFAIRLRRGASRELSKLPIHARLRQLRATDPPLLVAFPLLITGKAKPAFLPSTDRIRSLANDASARTYG